MKLSQTGLKKLKRAVSATIVEVQSAKNLTALHCDVRDATSTQ